MQTTDTPTEFKRGQRVLYTRSVLCGRAPEYGRIVKRHPMGPHGLGMPDEHWYVVRDEEPHPYGNGKFGKCSEHASMLQRA